MPDKWLQGIGLLQLEAVEQLSKVTIKPNQVGFNATMPTVAWIGGLRVVVYPNDHRPAHVHVIGGGCEAVFNLNCPHGPVELRENFGFSSKQLNRIKPSLAEELGRLCAGWSRIHESE